MNDHPSPITFDNTYANLPERFFIKQNPAHVPQPELIRLNTGLAQQLSIDPEWLLTPDGLGMLSGNIVPKGAEPLAQAYAGHQFGGFVPQLGDGRAILLGELVDTHGHRQDIQLKGSGRTPFSRGGDGKSALGPVIREYIVSEAMAALGVPTTRALAAVSTGESVTRQEGPLPGGVFTRVAASHIRVGTFQYFAARNDHDAIRELADYAIARHYPNSSNSENAPPYLHFFQSVIQAQAALVAQWMSIGFIHGVMNTDNTSISGETIDYGPCAFMDTFHPDCVFSSIDVRGRYAWGNQPNIAHWNLSRLAETLLPLFDLNTEKATQIAEEALNEFAPSFTYQYMARFRAKLGLEASAPDELIQEALSLIANEEVDFTHFFRHLTGYASGQDPQSLFDLFTDQTSIQTWLSQWQCADKSNTCIEDMRSANPIIIPRNHQIEKAIQAAYASDYAPFHRLADALNHPYSEQNEYTDLEQAPRPEEIVHQTFCGT